MGHARALLSLATAEQQRQLCRRIIDEGLSVRQVEALVSGTAKPRRKASAQSGANVRSLEERLRRALGTRVTIAEGRKGRGKIIIDFFSHEEFERLLEKLASDTSS